jgi:hypothetical protein
VERENNAGNGLNHAFSDQASGWHAQDLLANFHISRE